MPRDLSIAENELHLSPIAEAAVLRVQSTRTLTTITGQHDSQPVQGLASGSQVQNDRSNNTIDRTVFYLA